MQLKPMYIDLEEVTFLPHYKKVNILICFWQ